MTDAYKMESVADLLTGGCLEFVYEKQPVETI